MYLRSTQSKKSAHVWTADSSSGPRVKWVTFLANINHNQSPKTNSREGNPELNQQRWVKQNFTRKQNSLG